MSQENRPINMAKYMIREASGERRVFNVFEWNETDPLDLIEMGYEYCEVLPWDGSPVWTPVPMSITQTQFRKAIRHMGLRPYFDGFMASLNDEQKEELEYALEIQRNHPFMDIAKQMLQVDEKFIDDFFRYASSIV